MSCDRLMLARVLRWDLPKNPDLDRTRTAGTELRKAHRYDNSVENMILGEFIF